MRTLFNSRPTFWLLLALPGAVMMRAYLTGAADSMDMLHPTGETSARLLIAALAISPLMLLTNGAGWVRWLQTRRRYIGVAAFCYALMHTIFYVVDMGSVDAVLSEALLLGIWPGWLALFIMLALALTSNNAAMRRMKAAWKRLQRFAYPAALLTLLHWIVVHNGSASALLHALPLIILETYRLIRFFRKVPMNA